VRERRLPVGQLREAREDVVSPARLADPGEQAIRLQAFSLHVLSLGLDVAPSDRGGEFGVLYAVELSPDGTLAVMVIGDLESGNGDLWILEIERGLLTRFTSDDGNQYAPLWSPDGSGILYQSDASGRFEIYVQPPYPGPGRFLRASTAGGLWPRWSADGTEIYYQDISGILMAVPVRSAGSGLTLAPAVELFSGPSNGDSGQYGVAGDGRFLVIEPVAEHRPEPVTVLMNRPAVLDR